MTMQEASALDLDAEISAQAEIEKNETRDAVPLGAQAVRVDSHLEGMPAERRRTFQKVVALAKRAMKTSAEGDNVAAALLAHKAWMLAPDIALTNHVLGLMLYNLGRLSRALDFFEAAWKIDPKDAEIYQKLGLVAWKLDMLEAAEKFYRLQYKLAPTAVDAAINLGGVLRDAGKFEEAIEILRTAIYAHQDTEDDALIGVKSTARLFGKQTASWLRRFLMATVGLMGLAVIFAVQGNASVLALVIALGGPWAMGWHMAWQLRGLDIENSAKCLQLFRANRDTGMIPLLFFAAALLV